MDKKLIFGPHIIRLVNPNRYKVTINFGMAGMHIFTDDNDGLGYLLPDAEKIFAMLCRVKQVAVDSNVVLP